MYVFYVYLTSSMCVSHLLRGRAVHSHSSDMQWCGVRPLSFCFWPLGSPASGRGEREVRAGGEMNASTVNQT